MTRTNVDVDDELIDVIKERYCVATKREAIDLALRHLAGQPRLTRDEMLAMEGAELIDEVPEDQRPPTWG